MKRLAIFVTIILCMLSFAACGNDDSKTNETTTTKATTSNEDSSKPDEGPKVFDAKAILDEIIANYELSDVTKLDDVMFLDVLYGIKEDDVKQFSLCINETGISADEIIIIEAVDADATQRVLELVMNWYTAKGVQMKDYIPEEYEKIEKSSVKSSGNYVYMVVAENSGEIEKVIEKYI